MNKNADGLLSMFAQMDNLLKRNCYDDGLPTRTEKTKGDVSETVHSDGEKLRLTTPIRNADFRA